MKKKNIILILISIIIICIFLAKSMMNSMIKSIDTSSNDNKYTYNVEIKSDDIIVSKQENENNKKLINTTSDKMLDDFVKNKDKAIKKYENATLVLKIDLSNAELLENVFYNVDENDVETEIKTGLIGTIKLVSNDKKYTLYIDFSEMDNDKLIEQYKDKKIQKEYNLEKFKKLKNITVKVLDTDTLDFYNGEMLISVDSIESYK